MKSRQVLLNPGPVTLSERVRGAMTQGDWCHREPEFASLVREILSSLLTVHPSLAREFQAVLLTGSGTAAVEGMLAGFAPERSKTLVIANGVYGERMLRMLESSGRPHALLQHEWTEAIDSQRVAQALANDPSITHVAVVHHETTTGRLNDLAQLAEICLPRGAQLLVDAVSSFGAEEIDADAWNIGALAATANKCLHGVAGLSFVLARRSLWKSPPAHAPSVYLDLHAYHRAQHGDGFSPFTQAVQVAFALREALAEHREHGGYVARRALFQSRAERMHTALDECGVRTLLDPADYSSVLWSYRLPENRSYSQIHDALKAEGFVIYAGQGALAAQIFRIAYMGDIHEDELRNLASLFRKILRP
jgi:2-aminoethylphosphonate-pyruvate transaminase